MFSSSSKKDNPEAITTILGEGTVITGDMSFQGSRRIDGQFDGNLSGDYLIVSASGKVVGDVVAQSCVCYGQVRQSVGGSAAGEAGWADRWYHQC